jgi:2,4-dienoyl-CoA reductase-like NADH-dependent reductase (Old Yellow Enzyme family)
VPAAQDVGALYRPFSIGRVRLRNRLFVAPHTTNFAEGDNLVSDRYIAYLEERARGGAGLIITEGLRVHPSALRRFGIAGFQPGNPPRFAALADAVHAQGAKIFGQIMHTGRHDGSEFTGSWGPSPIPWTTGIGIPHEMTGAEIAMSITGFRRLAETLVTSGFDGIEVHLGHGHMLQQFLSPATNRRIDEYGGDPRRRQRLARDVLDNVFEVAGSAPVGARISADEMLPGGLGLEQMIDICGELLADYPLAFLHVSHSAYSGQYSLSTQMADMSFGATPFRHLPKAFKQAFPDVPVLAVCRMDDVATAASVLEEGVADLIGMARPHIADPDVGRKGLEGKRARSCIACNQGCVARLEKTLPIRCVVNPEVGLEREWRLIPRPQSRQRVLVIGGGPAGMEAAATAGRRGHAVVLAERADRLGGQINMIRSLTGRERFGLLADELELDVNEASVEVRLETTADAAYVGAGRWDVVVVATGSRPAPLSFASALTSWDAALDPGSVGHRVVVYDEEGFWPAAGLVEHFASIGRSVVLVTPMQTPCVNIDTYTKLSLFERYAHLDVTISTMRRIAGFERNRLVLLDTLNGAEHVIDGVDSLVMATPQVAYDGLFHQLCAAMPTTPIHLIGDAFAPRTALEATFEGRAAGSLSGLGALGGWQGPPLRTPYLGASHGGDLLRPGMREWTVTPVGADGPTKRGS